MQQLARVPHVKDEPDFLQFVNMFIAKRVEFNIVSTAGVKNCSVGPHLPSLQVRIVFLREEIFVHDVVEKLFSVFFSFFSSSSSSSVHTQTQRTRNTQSRRYDWNLVSIPLCFQVPNR